MIKIGFIFPSSDYLFNPFKGDPHTHLQILTILDAHFKNEVELSLIDLRGIKKEFVVHHIPECDVYLYSTYTLDIEEQIEIVKNLRLSYPKSKHVAGGPHVIEFRQESLKIFDSLVLGAGENAIIQVIDDIKKLKLKKIYEQKKDIDINIYPYPSRKFLPKSAIARKGMMAIKGNKSYEHLLGTTAIFSRGCPYNCCFCAMKNIKKYNNGIKFRKPELIEEEIKYLKSEYNIQGINVLDEIGIPLSYKKARLHLEAIGRTDVIWRGQCRVDGISPEIAKIARESGCIALGLGVESISQESLDIINKKITIEQARKTIRILKENNIEVRIYMILGLPGEKDDIAKKTWEFIRETEPDLVILSLFTIRPGTDVFNNPKKYGIRKINSNWKNTMHMFGRYSNELPTLTFEYEKKTPWGRGLSSDEIINNYLEVQSKLKEHGLAHL